MAIKKIALYGGSFNPPHVWHREIVAWLAKHFDEVIVVPCGHRRDKEVTNDMSVNHRTVMCGLNFRGIAPNVRVDYYDLEHSVFTSNWALQQRYAADGTSVWHVIGTDLLEVCEDGLNKIQRSWKHSDEIWRKLNWLVVLRPGHGLPEDVSLPPHHKLQAILDESGSSRDIRRRTFEHESVAGMVLPEIEDYINRHGLYRGRPSSGVTHLRIAEPRAYVHADEYNQRALAFVEALGERAVPIEQANLIIALGGDGTMLRAVHEFWERRLPFLGMNFGHAGFLMNQLPEVAVQKPAQLMDEIVKVRLTSLQLPLLAAYVDGEKTVHYGFNDIYIKAAAHTVPVSMSVTVRSHGREWQENVMGDGLVCATEAGSTGYAFQAGAEPLSLSADRNWLVKGICARRLPQISLDNGSEVEVQLRSIAYRKGVLCADNREIGPVERFRVRLSNVASAELAFLPGADLTAKRIDLVVK